ncbi:hypothetical protein [Komagataeibacter europaeus]|uniref:hypothetical protein n=1 Tax=Komagataeibacter europaeus TaxID=33995 RepID=UPI0003091A1D|nr:hypothetical protein [Komagataeibacter europaeus]GBQ40382.1 hypothetical protein AA18890_0779 [Komagataeibacter europaeus LMG 18890]
MTDLLSNLPSRQPAPLTVFQARLDAHAQQNWLDVFAGFSTLRAITFSSSLEFLLNLAEQFEDMEIIFGAEHILTKTHLALVQASQVFLDLLAMEEELGFLPVRNTSLLGRVVKAWKKPG